MGNDKVQGEGDYEAARRFQQDEKRFVEQRTRDGKPIKGDAAAATDEPTAAERAGLARAKDGGQDGRDAERMRKLEERGD